MHAEKNKGDDQYAQLNSCSALLFFSKSNHRFHSLSQDATFTMPGILKYVKITMHLQLIFNAWFCCVLVCCNIDLALLVVPGQVRPICSALAISFIHESSFITDTKSFSHLICTG